MEHPLQTPAWAKFRQTMGVDVAKIDDWYVSFHRLPHTPWTIGYFPKGPAPTKKMIDLLNTVGKEKQSIFIQLEPNVAQNSAFHPKDFSLLPSHHPLFTKYTFVMDLTKSEDELLKAMHPKTRYNIRVAQKHGVTISLDDSDEAFEAYLALTEETTKRQHFYAHNRTYHTAMWNTLHQAGIAHLFKATYQQQTLAAWIVFVHGDTVYYPYGASSRSHREVMAPNLLLWEIIRWAKQKKLHFFDLWGSMGPNPNQHDPWYGFHRFKEGFSPNQVEFIGSFDLVLRPMLYRAITIADTLRWFFLKRL